MQVIATATVNDPCLIRISAITFLTMEEVTVWC